jgi:ribosomal protein S18 acetylase RimI-like enzyme
MSIGVRPVRLDDFVAVTALLQELGPPAVLGSPDEDRARALFADRIGAPERFAFVAQEGGAIVGFLDLVLQPRLNFTALEAHVPDLVVSEGARSRGAGAALLAAAESLARERGHSR